MNWEIRTDIRTLPCIYQMQALVTQLYPTLWPHGLQPPRLFCPWNSPGQNTGVGCHSLLQGIFSTQELSLGPLHFRQILYCLSHQGSPVSGNLLYSPGSSAWCSLMTYRGWIRGVGVRFKMEEIYVDTQLIHFIVHKKLTQHFETINSNKIKPSRSCADPVPSCLPAHFSPLICCALYFSIVYFLLPSSMSAAFCLSQDNKRYYGETGKKGRSLGIGLLPPGFWQCLK